MRMSDVSIKQLAQACGVAISTASRAMNNRVGVSRATREMIQAKAGEIGYVPNAYARSLKILGEQTVAVIIQGHTSELLIQILSDLQEQLSQAGFSAFLQHVPDHQANFDTIHRITQERKPGGIIFLGRFGDTEHTSSDEINRKLSQLEIPVVHCTTADFSTPQSRHSSVSIDDVGGCAEVTRYLIDRGHTKIAFATVIGSNRLTDGHAWSLRHKGFVTALEDANIEVDPDLVIPSLDPVELYSMSNGYESVKGWLSSSDRDFTALAASCDAIALGAMRALNEAGLRVPDDVAVTGFDGLDFAQYCMPSLTTVVQPQKQIAYATARAMIEALTNSRHVARQEWIRGEIRMGESTGPDVKPALANVGASSH